MVSTQLMEEILGNVSMLQIWQLNGILQECDDDVVFVAIGEVKQEYLDKYGGEEDEDTHKKPIVQKQDLCKNKLMKAKIEIDECLSFLQMDLLHRTQLKRGYKETFACIRQINKEHHEKYGELWTKNKTKTKRKNKTNIKVIACK